MRCAGRLPQRERVTTRPQHPRVGSLAAAIVIAIAVAHAGGQTETPTARRFDLRSKPAPLDGSVVLRRGEQWSGEVPLGQGYLEVEARVNREEPAGSSYALEVSVNGQPLTAPPIIVRSMMRGADGRLVSRYLWDVRQLLRGATAARVRVRNLSDVPGEAVTIQAREGVPGAAASVPLPAGYLSDVVTALDVRHGQAIGITDQFTPEANPIFVWFRVAGVAMGTSLASRWWYLGDRGPVVVGTGDTLVKPGSDHGAFSLEHAPGTRWPAGAYRVEILAGGAVIGVAPFTVRPR